MKKKVSIVILAFSSLYDFSSLALLIFQVDFTSTILDIFSNIYFIVKILYFIIYSLIFYPFISFIIFRKIHFCNNLKLFKINNYLYIE
jgi:hypothetical protein